MDRSDAAFVAVSPLTKPTGGAQTRVGQKRRRCVPLGRRAPPRRLACTPWHAERRALVRHGGRIDPARSEKPRSLLNAPPPESSILPRARIITGTEIVSETVKGLLHC